MSSNKLCPFYGKPCLTKDCMAFHFRERIPAHNAYTAYCDALKIDIWLQIGSDEELTQKGDYVQNLV